MDGPELASWRRFYAICPFGPVRGDLQAGMVARAVYAGAGYKRLPGLLDFVIQSRRADKPTGSNEASQLEAISLASGIPFSRGN